MLRRQYTKLSKSKRPAFLRRHGLTEEQIFQTSTSCEYEVIKEFPGHLVGDIVSSNDDLQQRYSDLFKLYVKNNKPKVTHVYLIDISGSMSGPKIDTINNNIWHEIDKAAEATDAKFTIYTFSSFPVLNCKDDIKPIAKSFRAEGRTALNDCIVMAIDELDLKENILLKIFTDGDDNNSKNSTRIVRKKIKDLPKNVTVTFVGTKEDVKKCIREYEIDESNTLVHDNTGKGFEKVLEKYTFQTKTYATNLTAGLDVSMGFFDKQIL